MSACENIKVLLHITATFCRSFFLMIIIIIMIIFCLKRECKLEAQSLSVRSLEASCLPRGGDRNSAIWFSESLLTNSNRPKFNTNTGIWSAISGTQLKELGFPGTLVLFEVLLSKNNVTTGSNFLPFLFNI